MINNRKIKSNFIILCWIVFMVLLGAGLFFGKEFVLNHLNPKYVVDTKIENSSIAISILKGNKVDVTETISTGKDNKEFKKYVPLYNVFYNDYGIATHGIMKITDLRSSSGSVEVSKNDKFEIIKFNSNTSNVYDIKYRYELGKDFNKDKDIFSLVLLPKGEYASSSLSINLPNNINGEVHFRDGKNDITNELPYSVNKNSINVNLKDFKVENALSIYIVLPDEYLENESFNYGFISILINILIVAIIVAILSYYVSVISQYKKDYEKNKINIPEDLDVSEIGYLYGETDLDKLTYSLLLDLYVKGYLGVEYKDGKKYYVKINKELSTKELSLTEISLHSEIFLNGDTVLVDELDKNFLNNITVKDIYSNVDKKFNYIDESKKLLKSYIFMILTLLGFGINYLLIDDMLPLIDIVYPLIYLFACIIGVVIALLSRKLNHGLNLRRRVNEFKTYLTSGDKEEFGVRVFDNHRFYYLVLPYAYILEVKNLWINSFATNNVSCMLEVKDGILVPSTTVPVSYQHEEVVVEETKEEEKEENKPDKKVRKKKIKKDKEEK